MLEKWLTSHGWKKHGNMFKNPRYRHIHVHHDELSNRYIIGIEDAGIFPAHRTRCRSFPPGNTDAPEYIATLIRETIGLVL